MTNLKEELSFLANGVRTFQKPREGYLYTSLYEYVVVKGREMESKTPSPEQKRYLTKVFRSEGGRYPIKECFSNSQRVICADQEGRLAYYEGYATSGLIPVLHGWLVLDGEVLVDLTWRLRKLEPVKGSLFHTRIIGQIPEGYAYMGAEIARRKDILEQTLRTGSWRCFLDNWVDGYPFLKAQGPISQESV